MSAERCFDERFELGEESGDLAARRRFGLRLPATRHKDGHVRIGDTLLVREGNIFAESARKKKRRHDAVGVGSVRVDAVNITLVLENMISIKVCGTGIMAIANILQDGPGKRWAKNEISVLLVGLHVRRWSVVKALEVLVVMPPIVDCVGLASGVARGCRDFGVIDSK